MREIKFTTNYEPVLKFSDKDFKIKYEEHVGNDERYLYKIDGDEKHLAVCPRCDNPVVILGIYRNIDVSPHARHTRNIDIPDVAQYNEYKLERCPYHVKRANYIKEYVPETEEPQRHELYRIAKDHFDKAIYLLQKQTGLHISYDMAEVLAENYADMRAYNYIDATVYNIPWYLLYSYCGFNLHYMIVRKGTTLFRTLKSLKFEMVDSNIKDHVCIIDHEGYVLRATDYRYSVDNDDNLNESLLFSILKPDPKLTDVLLFNMVKRVSVKVDSSYFGNLVEYKDWKTNPKMLEIATKYMNP